MKKRGVLLLLLCLVFVQISCSIDAADLGVINEISHLFGSIDDDRYCENKGMRWNPDTKNCEPYTSPEVVVVPQDEEPAQLADTDEPSAIEEQKPTPIAEACAALPRSYAWWYDEITPFSGTGGEGCSGKLVIQNSGNERYYFELYTAYDNGTMKNTDWKAFPVEPLQSFKVPVSLVNYKDGTITYNKVLLILPLRDVWECTYMFTDESREAWWDALAVEVETFSCP